MIGEKEKVGKENGRDYWLRWEDILKQVTVLEITTFWNRGSSLQRMPEVGPDSLYYIISHPILGLDFFGMKGE